MSPYRQNVNPLRFLLIFFLAGIGCLIPFQSLHIRASSFLLKDSWLLLAAPPLISAIGPVVTGPLVDYLLSKPRKQENEVQNSCVKVFLSFTLLSAAILYSVLLIVPTFEIVPREPEVKFICDRGGSRLVLEKCGNCFRSYGSSAEILKVSNCTYDCSSASSTVEFARTTATTVKTTTSTTEELSTATTAKSTIETVTKNRPGNEVNLPVSTTEYSFFGPMDDDDEELGSGEEDDEYLRIRNRRSAEGSDVTNLVESDESDNMYDSPPHICTSSLSNPKMCIIYTPYSDPISFNGSLIYQQQSTEDKQDVCTYTVDDYFCRIPFNLEKENVRCHVECKSQYPQNVVSGQETSLCQQTSGDPRFSYWLYFTIRCLGDMFTSISAGLLLGSMVIAVQHRLGRELMLPSLVYGSYAILIGYLHSHSVTPLHLDRMQSYFLAIVGCASLFIVAILVILFSTELPLGPPHWWSKTRTNSKHKLEALGVLVVLFLLGIFWGPMVIHVPWHLAEVPGIELFLGGSVGLGALIAAPFLWKSDIIIEYCGYSYMFVIAFVFNVFKYVGLYSIKSPWILVINGGMDVFTFYFVLITGALYLRALFSNQSTFTAMSLLVAAHFCAGSGVGSIISSYISQQEIQAWIFDKISYFGPFSPQSQYSAMYLVFAMSATLLALVYFVNYYLCYKVKNLGNDIDIGLPLQENTCNDENSSSTPLRVYHNGRNLHTPQTD